MENQKNNVIDLTEKLKGREISTGYMIVNVPVVLFYNQIGDMKQQTFNSKNIEGAPILSIQLKQGELKFLGSSQETIDNLEYFMQECKAKANKDADIIELADGE